MEVRLPIPLDPPTPTTTTLFFSTFRACSYMSNAGQEQLWICHCFLQLFHLTFEYTGRDSWNCIPFATDHHVPKSIREMLQKASYTAMLYVNQLESKYRTMYVMQPTHSVWESTTCVIFRNFKRRATYAATALAHRCHPRRRVAQNLRFRAPVREIQIPRTRNYSKISNLGCAPKGAYGNTAF